MKTGYACRVASHPAQAGGRLLARLFVFFGGLIVLALTAALVAPHFIDWSSYRGDFEREAGRILGREVTVRGAPSVRLLPFPSVTFTDVVVAGAGADAPAMTVESFSMDAELAPLMRGEFLIFDMRLEKPTAVIDVAADGKIDWALRPSTPMDAHQIRIEKMTVADGKVLLRHAAAGRNYTLSEMNFAVSATSLAGPWRMDGSLRVDGEKSVVSASTGALDQNGHLRLRMKAEPERYDFILETDGDTTLDAGAFVYNGTFRLNAKVPDQTASAGAPKAKVPPAYRVAGKFGFDHRRVDVPEFRIETGPLADPYVADGRGNIQLGAAPRFELVADGAQMRLDQATGTDGAASLETRLAGLRETLLDLPRPTIPGSVEIKLPAIVAGDTTVRDVRLSAQPLDGDWQISTLAATLPGRTTLEGSGLLSVASDALGFKGKLLLAVAQPSGFAAWLSRDVDGPIRRLAGAGFSADVELTQQRQALENLELQLGDATFRGRVVNEERAGARPALSLELDGQRLDVGGLAAFTSLFLTDAGAVRLADRDVDLKLKAGPLEAGGLQAERLDTQMRLRGGRLEIDRLALGGLEGADISATGSIDGIGSAPVGSLDATVLSGDLGPLVSRAAEVYPESSVLAGAARRVASYPDLLSEAEVSVVASLAAERGERRLALSAQGKAGGGTFSASIAGAADPAVLRQRPLKLQVQAQNAEPAAVYALYGIPGLPLGLAAPLRTELTIDGILAKGAATRVAFAADDLAASYDGTLTIGDTPSASGKVALKSGDLSPWLIAGGLSLPGMAQGLPVNLTAGADLSQGLLVLSDLAGSAAGGPASGDLNLAVRDGLPAVSGALELATLDLDLLAEALFGPDALVSADESWPNAPFAPRAALPFAADLQVDAEHLLAGSTFDGRDASFTVKLDRQGARFSEIALETLGGRLTGLAELSNSGGSGLLSAQLKLEDADIGAVLPGSGMAGRGTVTASVSGSGKSVEALAASLSGAGTISTRDLSLPGLAAEALPSLLAAADKAGPQITAAQVAGFAPQLVQRGRVAVGAQELAVTIAGGTARTAPLRVELPQAVLSAEARLDFNTLEFAATGSLQYKPGPDAVAGGDPVVRFAAEGPAGNILASYDTELLAQFLTQRALEKEQARVEAMQSAMLEKQRLRREARFYASLMDERQKAEDRRRQEAEARTRAEQEARAKAEAEARAAAEEAARRAAQPVAPQAAPQPAAPAQSTPQPQAPAINGLPGVNPEPIAPALPRADSGQSPREGAIAPGSLTVDGLMKAIQTR